METLIQKISEFAWQDLLAGALVVAVFTIFVPAIKALNDALSKAIYGLISSKITQTSISLGGLSVKLQSLSEIDTDRSDPEYLGIIEERINEIKDALETANDRGGFGLRSGSELDWRDVFEASRERLLAETERLQSRSQANLLFGATTSLMGILLLVFLLFIFPPQLSTNDWKEVLIVYGPRIALVLIVELISTFFFRLYVSNENDIKLNKNEITNVEMRFASVLMADNKRSSTSRIAELLATEERNFILRKGERAVGESSSEKIESLMSDFRTLLSKKTGDQR